MAPSKRSRRANNLLAILLVTRSRPGPRLAFHYPPTPHTTPATKGEAQDTTGGSDDDSDSGTEDVISTVNSKHDASNRIEKVGRGNSESKTNLTKNSLNGDVLAIAEDSLEKLLSPGCWSDKKKFEVCVDGLTFVGHPAFADHDGSWARGHKHEPSNASTLASTHNPDMDAAQTQSTIAINIANGKNTAMQVHDFKHVSESLDSRIGSSLATSFNSESTTSPAMPEPLTMFHVVFVLGGPARCCGDTEVAMLHSHVAKKLTKALQYCQKQSTYVGFESRKLLALRTKAKQAGTAAEALSKQCIEASELAWALKELYERLSSYQIAGVRLNGMEISLKLPDSDHEDEDEEQALDRHSGLLLLEDKDTMLRDLAHPDASPLAYFIREHVPTKSLQKLATRMGFPIDKVLYLAQHLIDWRKARAIAPLHPRNSYIVGANAPLETLSQHMSEYAHKFSALPSLPQMLKILSDRPIRYGMLIPSRDHRAPYMDILAYLVQHKFVEQLKTFGWLQATPAVQSGNTRAEANANKRPLSVLSLLSPQMRPADDDTVSISSERTAIPLSSGHPESRRDRKASSVPSVTLDDQVDTFDIIKKPDELSATDLERLRHIKESVNDEELSGRVLSLVQYFNGDHALENIAAIEGLKRGKVETWLEVLQKEGFLLTFRHS